MIEVNLAVAGVYAITKSASTRNERNLVFVPAMAESLKHDSVCCRLSEKRCRSNVSISQSMVSNIVQTSSKRYWPHSNKCCSKSPVLCPECSHKRRFRATHKPHLRVYTRSMPQTRHCSCRHPICIPRPPRYITTGCSHKRA